MTRLFRILIAVLTVISLSACVTNRSLGEGVDDTSADAAMKTLLLKDSKHKFGDVDITVFEGRLMLTGTVANQETLVALENHSRKLKNVTEVLNEVVVSDRTGMRQGWSDAMIDRKLVGALTADNGVYRNNYQVAVSQGTVYLLGVAQGPVELERVTGHAQTIKGVNRIVSHVIYVGDPRRTR